MGCTDVIVSLQEWRREEAPGPTNMYAGGPKLHAEKGGGHGFIGFNSPISAALQPLIPGPVHGGEPHVRSGDPHSGRRKLQGCFQTVFYI